MYRTRQHKSSDAGHSGPSRCKSVQSAPSSTTSSGRHARSPQPRGRSNSTNEKGGRELGGFRARRLWVFRACGGAETWGGSSPRLASPQGKLQGSVCIQCAILATSARCCGIDKSRCAQGMQLPLSPAAETGSNSIRPDSFLGRCPSQRREKMMFSAGGAHAEYQKDP